ncbi:uncharacterized protein LOC117583396 isoform X2 [Drosophila guanche]|uniref:uncharacterized protein LOC117583396 isoform X2 n=1 Tax=Drosophila guanche TaxID=7266 RepID=UPI0014708F9A|nr:uncharacterized protein LOC117583396 isoform X2 [Drosophila guanche]
MESTNENEHDDASVLAPTPLGKQSGRTHKDTPLAMKTRHGRKKSQANPELGSPTNPEPPKTPPSSRRIMTKNETPRRSARKSVRPALDYDDIMLRSATKEMKNKRLNTSNVTNRRKRSMSVDEIRPKGSRIPQPKFFKGSQVITPSKVKMRTKLPNFAAIHQKQFAKMENLVDHLDRKAVRAKVLTSSALKHEPGAGSTVKKMPSSSAVAAGDCSRPRALRKIDWCNPTAAKQPENELHEPPRPATSAKVPSQSRLPLKSGSNIVSKPAFNLSTNVVKKFTATSTATTVPTGFEDKVAERRQRHMEMFKSRSAPKEKTGQFIRGVRLNRRFELQMQHRRHMEEE